MPDGNIGFGRF